MISCGLLILGFVLVVASVDPRCAQNVYSFWRCGIPSILESDCISIGCCWDGYKCYFKDRLREEKCNVVTERLTCGHFSPQQCEDRGCCYEPAHGLHWCYRSKETGRGLCRMAGDPHYTTYDGRYFDFMGECTFIVSETKSLEKTNPRWFSVQVKNVGNGRVSWVNTATVLFNGGKTNIILREDGAQVNGEDAYEAKTSSFTLRTNGNSRTVAVMNGPTVTFDSSAWAVYVELPESYRNQVHGLCGNFDGDSANDLVNKEGTPVSDVIEFAMSYVVGHCGTTPSPPPICTDKDKWSSNQFCGSMTDRNGVFAECVDKIKTEGYFNDCVMDLCATDSSQTTELFIGSLEVYLEACGAKICDWKKELDLPRLSCPENSEYSGCASGCPDTCMFPDASKSCETTQSEGCVCNEGYVSDAGKCIPREQCGCVVDGLYHPKGEKERKLATREECVCSESQEYTCKCLKGLQRKGDVCESITSPWHEASNHLFYKVFQQYSDYETAKATCIENGAILASRGLRDLNVREEVVSFMDEYSPTWIGVNDINDEGTWVWEDGIVSDNDIKWGSGQPGNSNDEYDCAFYVTGVVVNRPCSRSAWFFCEREY